ncbi:hypothetical protein V2J09_002297 [Rumex salicifolius]
MLAIIKKVIALWNGLNNRVKDPSAKKKYVHYRRLRAVCTTWRSSLHLRPSPFHLKVPPLFSYCTGDPILPEGSDYSLKYTTLYQLSPLEHAEFQRITEISKCYELDYLDSEGSGGYLKYMVRKVVLVPNHSVDCDSAVVVVVLYSDRQMSYWKVGDEVWAPINTKDYDMNDVVVCQGKCYAISCKGVLYSLDSGFNLEFDLVEYKSELYAVSKIYEEDVDTNEVSLQMKIFKMCDNSWKRIRCLGNDMLISSDTVSIGLSSENFKGRRGNCVYVAHTDNVADYAPGKLMHMINKKPNNGRLGDIKAWEGSLPSFAVRFGKLGTIPKSKSRKRLSDFISMESTRNNGYLSSVRLGDVKKKGYPIILVTAAYLSSYVETVGHAVGRYAPEKRVWATFLALPARLLVFMDMDAVRDRVYSHSSFLSWSRKLELEADYIGFLLMASAGYDSSIAVEVRKKRAKLSKNRVEAIWREES